MISDRSLCRTDLQPFFGTDAGIVAFGVAKAEKVAPEMSDAYRRWLDEGCHGTMSYLERYGEVRDDPSLLIDSGARSLIVCAFPYAPLRERDPHLPRIARYAMGRDYHEVVRERLLDIANQLKSLYGGEWRACVDTAPLRERYWAVRSGLGFIGRNGQLIVPGAGSYVFIGTLLTTLDLAPDEPCTRNCAGCGACERACPGNALRGDGTLDARRCLSYLTIEYRGEFPAGTDLCNTLYGCDRCQEVCPHNKEHAHALLSDFEPSDDILTLSEEALRQMDEVTFRLLFRHSAIKRTRLSGLQRNLKSLS